MSNIKHNHVKRIHIPAHLLGLIGIAYVFYNPSLMTLVSFLIFNFWFSCLGMSVGFHRYFSHRAFITNKFWEKIMLIGGSLAGQGSVLFWVALHRMHHSYTETSKDMHSPIKGLWHAYMGWVFVINPADVQMVKASDWIRDPWCKFTHKHYNNIINLWWIGLISCCILAPILIPFISGIFIAGLFSIHQEAIINSFSHNLKFGYRNYHTRDTSVNIGWLGYFTWGQMLHNNHHGDPRNPDFGDDINKDLGYCVIKKIRNRI